MQTPPPFIPVTKRKYKDTSNMGRPSLPEKEKLKYSLRTQLDTATDRAMRAEMKASDQTRSRVIRRLIREGLRGLGHNIPLTSDEKRES